MNRALLVGINAYPGNELRGCINDVTDMAEFLVSHCDFDEDEIRLLTDARATTQAIEDRLHWLIGGVKAGDRIVFHYSGHGAQFPIRGADGKLTRVDECICPVDFDWTDEHSIRDKEFNQLFSSIPKGPEFIWISDSCFSGDLAREMLVPEQRIKALAMPADIAWRLRTAETKGVKPQGFEHVVKNLNGALVSGCGMRETSCDAQINGRFNGALTYYLLQTLSLPNGLSQPLEHAVARTRAALQKNGYTQHPQLEGATNVMQRPFLTAPVQRKAAGA